jgi:VWFA-related protein
MSLTPRAIGGLMLLAAVQSPAQQQPAPVFRGGTTILPLTVTVLDRKGVPVEDLSQADFTIFENGVKQDIRHFFPQHLLAEAALPRAEAAPVRAEGLAPETRRSVLIVLGQGRIQIPAKGIDGAIDFVSRRLLPQDVVAISAFNRVTEFTGDHARAIGVLERYRREHERIFFEIREHYMRVRNGGPLPESIERRIDAVFGEAPSRNAVDLLLGMDTPRGHNEPAWNRQMNVADALRMADRSGYRLSELLIGVPLLKMNAGIEYLRQVPGQRRLIWIGGGLRLRSADDDRKLAAHANDARVVLDVIHTVGVSSDATGWDISAAERVTQLTGGYFTGVRYAHEALATVDDRSRFSYLLGYSPSRPELDGKFRQVKVVVNRPGVTVSFQHGYYAIAEPAHADARELVTSARLASAGGFDEPIQGIKVRVTAVHVSMVENQRSVRVELAVDPSRISLTPMNGRRTGALDVQIFCGDGKQNVIGDARKRANLNLTDATYQRALTAGLPIAIDVPVTAAAKYVKAVIYDYTADLVGSAFMTIK